MSVRAGATSGTVRARRAVITTCIANAIEWYDFAVYGALASVLATVLLSPRAESGALTVIFAVFSTSFLARPLGSLLIGVHADRFGRQRALAAMIMLSAMLRMRGIRMKGDHHTRRPSRPTGSATSRTSPLRSRSVVITRGQDGTITLMR